MAEDAPTGAEIADEGPAMSARPEQDPLAALSDAAPPGPWEISSAPFGSIGVDIWADDANEREGRYVAESLPEPDASFIVALVNAYRSGALVPAARLAEAERLLAALLLVVNRLPYDPLADHTLRDVGAFIAEGESRG